MTVEEADIRKEIRIAQFELNVQDAQKRIDSTDAYGQAGLKSLVLVNGGAILSLLTFIGNNDLEFFGVGIFWAFIWFVLGLASALGAHFGAYFSQNFYMRAMILASWKAKFEAHDLEHEIDSSPNERRGHIALAFAIGGATLSLIFFVIGTFVAVFAIT